MSYEFGHTQNPSTTLPNIPPKIVKQIVSKNKSTKRSRKTNPNNINNNNTNINTNTTSASLRVVYISNPMKFQVNVDEFQTLVQELTGRDAIEWTDENYHKLGRGVVNVSDMVVIQPQPLDEQQVVQVESYGSSSDDFGPLDVGFVCGGEDNNGYLIDMDDFQAFMYGL